MLSGILSKQSILNRIHSNTPLLEDYLDLEQQIQPNGFDCTLRSIEILSGAAQLGTKNEDRKLPDTKTIEPDSDSYYNLSHGSYLITLNEIVTLPSNIMALARPRSSLLRSGIAIHTAIWDAGYSGRSQCLLVNTTNIQFKMMKNSRVLQMIFAYLDHSVKEGYSGIYQYENTKL